jgi:hypothetical protein
MTEQTEYEKQRLAEVEKAREEKEAEIQALVEVVTEAVLAKLEGKTTKKGK